MKIYLHEITDLDTELDFSEKNKWLLESVARVDECAPPASAAPRSIQAHVVLNKVDDVVVLNGDIDTHIELLCSRCANPFQMKMNPKLSALFCKDPIMAGIAHLQKSPGREKTYGTAPKAAEKKSAGKPVGQNKGHARHAHDFSQDAAVEHGTDLDITYLSEDFIDLGQVLTEQLQLQVPFQPLCKTDCKGICSNCGADLNVGRCACAKLGKNNPFTNLQNLKF
jgi:uncharacterized metal-binding protein YceD (DUF177 family)